MTTGDNLLVDLISEYFTQQNIVEMAKERVQIEETNLNEAFISLEKELLKLDNKEGKNFLICDGLLYTYKYDHGMSEVLEFRNIEFIDITNLGEKEVSDVKV